MARREQTWMIAFQKTPEAEDEMFWGGALLSTFGWEVIAPRKGAIHSLRCAQKRVRLLLEHSAQADRQGWHISNQCWRAVHNVTDVGWACGVRALYRMA